MPLYERSGDDIDQGLIGYYKLDDLKASQANTNIIDYTNFNDGTLADGIGGEDINGVTNNAITFDGADTLIDNGTSIIPLGEFSISVWLKTITGAESVFARVFDDGTNILFVHTSDKDINFTGGTTLATADNLVFDGLWYNVVITRDITGTDTKIYLNGDLKVIGTSGTPSAASTNLIIGNNVALSRSFKGNMANIRIYNRILPQGQVTKLFRLRK